MITIRTTQYYKAHFGRIQSDMTFVGLANNEKVFQYIFSHPDFLYEWLNEVGLSIKQSKIFKGNTVVGGYLWEKPVEKKKNLTSQPKSASSKSCRKTKRK